MLYDPQNFLHSMCRFAAARAATSLNPAVSINYKAGANTQPFNLFANEANEDFAADPYAVVRIYNGSHERSNPKPTIAIQLAVYGSSNVASAYLANVLFRCFCLTGQEVELRGISVPGYKAVDDSADGSWTLVDAVVVQGPSNVGRDDRKRIKIVSNFDLGFYKSA